MSKSGTPRSSVSSRKSISPMIETYPSRAQFLNHPIARVLLESLEAIDSSELGEAQVYLGFPLYRDDEGGLVMPDVMLISKQHGVVGFALLSKSDPKEVERCLEIQDQVPSFIHSRLIKNRQLRKRSTQLLFPVECQIFSPSANVADLDLVRPATLRNFLTELRTPEPLPDSIFKELISTIDGAKGLVKPVKRLEKAPTGSKTKGSRADELEASIMLFDQRQKHGIMGRVSGPQRIRGLAGSGKTVVLAMKAAQTLLQNPNAKIAYTFWTKSLYQHVKRLITRFYRQFDDKDPDWEKSLHVIHGWGGSSITGMYSTACARHNVRPINLVEAGAYTYGDRFDYACKDLLSKVKIEPYYDYIFVDEAQDFPLPFLQLCHQFAKGGKFVIGYDDLQTIFQPNGPDSASIFGRDAEGKALGDFEEDIVLHKCYRNPREVLVTAHAIGFGIYGKRIVQMLEGQDQWEDVGYKVLEGDFTQGSRIRIERPLVNSLDVLSKGLSFEELVDLTPCDSIETECSLVASRIKKDIEDDLRPEDILVVCVDDRYAKKYLSRISGELEEFSIRSNNLHDDSFGLKDFSQSGRVTLATVHKAKGNEAFMVYVVGCDSAMTNPNVRSRNMLFTAMTRAKGWVRLSGCWDSGKSYPLQQEYAQARQNFPELVFDYPGPDALKIIKRDLAEAADKKMKAERLLDQLREEFSEDEIRSMLSRNRRKKKD